MPTYNNIVMLFPICAGRGKNSFNARPSTIIRFHKRKKKEGNLHLFQLQCFKVPQYKFLVYTILSPLPHMVNCTAFKQLFYKKIK